MGQKMSTVRNETMQSTAAHGAAGLAAMLAAAVLLAGIASPAWADDDAPAATSSQCLVCHSAPGFEKNLPNGESLSLTVNPDLFGKSVHDANGCQSCHADVDLKTHPATAKEITDKRAFSVGMVEVCRTCHSDKFDEWEGSIHASQVRDGNPAAPICTNCHRPHAVIKGAAENFETVPCRPCHADVVAAYAGSVHGLALQGGNPAAPLCSGCHTAHQVKPTAVSMGNGLDIVCSGCHADVVDAHKRWLPNTELHFEVVSCPACHAPAAHRKVDLTLYDSTTQTRVTHPEGVPVFEDRSGKGLDALALWKLLQAFNRENMPGKTVLRGRLEVSNGPEGHQLTRKDKAISDCRTCHRSGAAPFQSVTISIAGPDGRPLSIGASKEVLSSVISLGSVGGFYAIGATRITVLDILFLLGLLAGIAIPVGHFTLRMMFKHYLKQHPAPAAAPPPAAPTPPGPPAA
jgi:hypothetical protein